MAGRTLGNAVHVSTGDANFWGQLQTASSNEKIGFFRETLPTGGPLYIVNMGSSIKMIPFVRSAEELFETTVKRESVVQNLKVIINGPTYGLTSSGYADVTWGSDPVPAADTLQQGRIVRNKKVIGGSKSNMYYVANYITGAVRYKFAQGTAPENADAALGNMGPLIINKLPFGKVNKYSPQPLNAVLVGKPTPAHQSALIQRSNARFTAMANSTDTVGKVAIGYRKDKQQLLILIQPHGSMGISIAGLRGVALHLGLDSAVYLDGSDSVMLVLDGNVLIPQASNKNETNITGVGFAY